MIGPPGHKVRSFLKNYMIGPPGHKVRSFLKNDQHKKGLGLWLKW
jgi:hypothetical protein